MENNENPEYIGVPYSALLNWMNKERIDFSSLPPKNPHENKKTFERIVNVEHKNKERLEKQFPPHSDINGSLVYELKSKQEGVLLEKIYLYYVEKITL
ncbi:MAG: hypothetical protein KKA64_03985 [Nanoarchaeota archaeon]|nr:hypothetical protein [Nanoarchaeota archaeon]